MGNYDGFLLPAIGFVATGFAVSGTIPQINKVLKNKEVDELVVLLPMSF